jgi:hypothetical protein
MKASEWIALVQGLFLAVGAAFAWRAYRLSKVANEREPRRRLLADAIDELKALALASETYTPGGGGQRLDLITGHQRRLAVAIAFVPWAALRDTHALTRCPAQEVTKDAIEDAAGELHHAMRALDLGLLDDDGYLSISGGELPPLRAPSFTKRLRGSLRNLRRLRLR